MQLTAAMVSYYSKTLRSLSLSTRAEKTRSFLNTSPVKLLSSFWTSNSNSNNNATDSVSSRHSKVPSLSRNNSQSSIFGSFRGNKEKAAAEAARPENPLVRLEQTFTAYVAALQGRKGTIIGRTLLNRSMADELTVNDLYNKMIESPYDFDVAAELPTEVVFVAFEKFLHIAWAEQMGPVMSIQSLDTLQERANKRVPGDFADFVNFLFGDMAPQNRRSFTSLIRLLAGLLEGCGNDSDRGALTLAFAELLVADGSGQNYINLLDRLVEDCDRIFEEPGLNHSFNLGNAAYESINLAIRGDKSYTPSLTSNTSSLRRKFGLEGLLRQNSKDERSSVWRTGSKHRNPATGEASSISKGTIDRTRSIDDNSLAKKGFRRPASRDRPPIIGGTFEDYSRPNSAHRSELGLETIGEPAYEPSPPKARRKRRSSLSDLKSLMAAVSIDDDEPEPLRPLQIVKQSSERINSTTKPMGQSRIPVSPNADQLLKMSKEQSFSADPFVQSKANAVEPSKQDSPSKATTSKTLLTSNIPTLKPSRLGASGPDSPTRGSSNRTGNKLRLPSPQKLRERLQTEKQTIEELDASLRSELSKIGEEMARVNKTGLTGGQSTDLQTLSASIKALEQRIPTSLAEIQAAQGSLEGEMETVVKASEQKVKAIDQLYKETIAENELLYERFNGELGKLVKALKGKGRDDKEELMTKLKDQSEESAKLKKENAKLKREMISLRAALKGTD